MEWDLGIAQALWRPSLHLSVHLRLCRHCSRLPRENAYEFYRSPLPLCSLRPLVCSVTLTPSLTHRRSTSVPISGPLAAFLPTSCRYLHSSLPRFI